MTVPPPTSTWMVFGSHPGKHYHKNIFSLCALTHFVVVTIMEEQCIALALSVYSFETFDHL